MRKVYVGPELQISEFQFDEIITASTETQSKTINVAGATWNEVSVVNDVEVVDIF